MEGDKGLAVNDVEPLAWSSTYTNGLFIKTGEGVMGAVSKLIIAGLLFLGVGLCVYGYLAQKLISISVVGVLAVSAVCAGIFIYFALFDPER